MSRSIDQTQLFKALLAGVKNAQSFYEKASNGSWLWEAPEYLICTHIAQSLVKLDGAIQVTLESNVHKTLSDASATKTGAPPKKLRNKGRFDIVIWWGGGTPRAAIEVKNQVYSYSQIYKDVERIESLIKRNVDNSSFQFGAIVFYTSCIASSHGSAEYKIEKRLGHILAQLKAHVTDSVSVKMHSSQIKVVADSAWVASCVVLKFPA